MDDMFDDRELSNESFDVSGVGFHYNYNNKNKELSVTDIDTERLLTQWHLDDFLSRKPHSYVSLLEKATQIKALMVSNNRTVDLSKVMETHRMKHILKSVASLSHHAYDLKNLYLGRFGQRFAQENDLQSVKLKKFVSNNQENEFFIARVQTHNGNGICVRACTLTGMMAAMSDRTLRDLMTMEFGLKFENSAQRLLNASSKLSSLSFVLDQNFVPKSRVMDSDSQKIHNNPDKLRH